MTLFLPLSWPYFPILVSGLPFICCHLVTKSCPSLCDPHELQHTRLPCPSLSPGVCWNSCCPLHLFALYISWEIQFFQSSTLVPRDTVCLHPPAHAVLVLQVYNNPRVSLVKWEKALFWLDTLHRCLGWQTGHKLAFRFYAAPQLGALVPGSHETQPAPSLILNSIQTFVSK